MRMFYMNFINSIRYRLILSAVNKILKLKKLNRVKENFNSDFLQDIGIINLLRKKYLKTGDIKKRYFIFMKILG